MRSRKLVVGSTYALVLLLSAGTSACLVRPALDASSKPVVGPGRGKGPPAHAPAHGFRRKFERDGVRLQFDGALGVYVVLDLTHVFFEGDRYYRWSSGGWLVSSRPSAGWVAISVDDVPSGLRGYRGKAQGPKRGRGNSPNR